MKQFLFFILFLISIGLVSAACTTNSCTNIGQIQTNTYCSTDGVWCAQLLNGISCDNDFECLSGNCIEETCSSTSAKQEYEQQKYLSEQILAYLSGLSGQDCLTIGAINTTTKLYCNSSNKWQAQKYGNLNCTNNYECLSNSCINNTCTCTSSTNCPSGQVCSTNKCIVSSTGGNGGGRHYTSTTNYTAQNASTQPTTTPYQYVPPTVTQPVCGNGVVDTDENCANCPQDVPCLDNEVCKLGECVPKKKISLLWFIIPLILILLIILFLILRRRKTFVFLKEKEKIRPLAITSAPKKQTKMIYANRFSEIRLKEGLKKTDLAKEAKVSTSTITNIEKNIEVKELSKRAVLQAVNSLIEKRTGAKSKYSYEQVFLEKPTGISKEEPLFPSRTAELTLKNFIRKALAAKMPKERIKSGLILKGWKEKQIEYILKELK